MKTISLQASSSAKIKVQDALSRRPDSHSKHLLRSFFLLFCGFFFLNNVHAGVVTNTNNSGAGSLRAVVTAAVSGEVITFSPSLIASGSATIVLTSQISIAVPVTITGLMNGSDTLFISGNSTNRIFVINFSPTPTSTITLNSLALIDARNDGGDGGAVTMYNSGHLMVNNCVFRNNSAMNGASIYFAEGTTWSYELAITNCSFYNNSATRRGAAVIAESTASSANSVYINITNSTISGNSSGWGGTVYCSASVSSANFPGAATATINMYQCTVCNNTGSTQVESYTSDSNNSSSTSNAYVNITNSTIVNNGANAIGSTGDNNSRVGVISSIIFGGVQNNKNQKIYSDGDNLFSVASLNGSVASDAFGVSAASIALSPLGFHGGPTKTMVPMPGSVAIDNGSTSTVNAQNGPVVGVRDVGSGEQTSSYSTQIVSSCGPYTWINGTTYTSSNTTATYTMQSTAGNDSVITLNLTVLPVYNQSSLLTICPGSSYSFGTQTLTTSGTYVETFDAVTGCDSTVTLTLNVADAIAPVPSIQNLPNLTNQCSITSLTAPTAMDNCAGTITGTHTAVLPITASTTITWTYNDGHGNVSTQIQTIIISDNSAPVPNLTSLTALTGQCSITSLTAPVATDNCSGTVTGTHNAVLPITASTTLTWTYNDGHGNSSTQTQNVVISDNTAPVPNVTSLATLTDQCGITSLTAPTATDNCAGTITGTHNAVLPITSSATITWTYNDGHGNSSTQTQDIVIDDNTAPVPNVTSLATLTNQCSITALTAPTATDNCVGTITGTHNTVLPITSSAMITWTFNDGHGNSSTQTQNVVISDNTAPVANAASLTDLTAQCTINALIPPTATDNCAGTITGTPNVTLPISVQGSFTITWTYNDGNGNISTQTQNVIIDDQTAPVPANAILSPVSQTCSVASLNAPVANDNCAGVITGTTTTVFPIVASGIVTWTYNDGNGNSSTQTQNVTILNDVTAPVANSAALPAVNSVCEVTALAAPMATDNCAGTITATTNAVFPLTESATITWTYNDGNGNSSTQTQEVVISPIDVSTQTVLIGNNAEISANAAGFTYQWIKNCGTTNELISGATAQTFTAAEDGSYSVIISNGSCSYTSECVVVNYLGIDEEQSLWNVSLFPNPAQDIVHISVNGPVFSLADLNVFDASGKQLSIEINGSLADGTVSIDPSDLAPGVYTLMVTLDGTTVKRRMVIL